jgi:hypothetical protein
MGGSDSKNTTGEHPARLWSKNRQGTQQESNLKKLYLSVWGEIWAAVP